MQIVNKNILIQFKNMYFYWYYVSWDFSIMDAKEFEWESQLRFYWEKEPDELVVRQCTGEFGYGYEYMGLNGRLVITPLTDRIYLTLTQVNKEYSLNKNKTYTL